MGNHRALKVNFKILWLLSICGNRQIVPITVVAARVKTRLLVGPQMWTVTSRAISKMLEIFNIILHQTKEPVLE